jgi:hypothetical protein
LIIWSRSSAKEIDEEIEVSENLVMLFILTLVGGVSPATTVDVVIIFASTPVFESKIVI